MKFIRGGSHREVLVRSTRQGNLGGWAKWGWSPTSRSRSLMCGDETRSAASRGRAGAYFRSLFVLPGALAQHDTGCVELEASSRGECAGGAELEASSRRDSPRGFTNNRPMEGPSMLLVMNGKGTCVAPRPWHSPHSNSPCPPRTGVCRRNGRTRRAVARSCRSLRCPS